MSRDHRTASTALEDSKPRKALRGQRETPETARPLHTGMWRDRFSDSQMTLHKVKAMSVLFITFKETSWGVWL